MLLASCVSPAAVRPLRPAVPHDDGVQLAAWLPERADRCVVVRPGRIPARRRGLAFRVSLAGSHPWDSELRVRAYAQARVELPDGRSATRSYLRFGGSPSSIAERARGLHVRWLEEECEGDRCRLPVARWVDERTIEIARGEWPRRRGSGGSRWGISTARCVSSARRYSDAVEVSVRISIFGSADWLDHPFGLGGLSEVARVVVGDRRGLVIRTTHRYADAEAARLGAELLERRAFPTMSPFSAGADRVIDVDGERVYVRHSRRWSELEVAGEDERLRREARAHLRRRSEPIALSAVDVSNLAVVRHQIRLRSAPLERRVVRGAMRRDLTGALAELLRRSFDAHPSEIWLARQLVRVELDENGRADAALEVAERVLSSGLGGDPRVWRTLRREALAHGGVEPLRAALVADGLARGEEALRAAQDLVRLRAEAVSYEWAEGAWRLSREMRVSDVVPTRGTLSRGGVIGALVALALSGGGQGYGTLHVTVSTPSELETAAVGRTGPELVVVRAPGGGSVIVGAAPTLDLLEARRLAELIDQLVPAGEVSYVVQLGEPGSRRVIRLRLDGTVSAGAFTIRRGSRGLRNTPWPAVQRYLARPLHDMPSALFPPPTLAIRAESPEVAVEIRRQADRLAPGACQLAGPYLRCRAPGRPESLGALLLELARGRIQPAH